MAQLMGRYDFLAKPEGKNIRMASCGLSPTRAVNECKLPANDITKIKLYGNDHSPWVQAIMLGLHEKSGICVLLFRLWKCFSGGL